MADYTVAKIDELEGYYNGHLPQGARGAGRDRVRPVDRRHPARDSVHYPEHNHPSGQEEVLICIKGFGRLILDEGAEYVDLEPGMMVRIGAKTKRTIRVGDEGLRAVAIGGVPGEAFKPLAYTEIGALDPLLKRRAPDRGRRPWTRRPPPASCGRASSSRCCATPASRRARSRASSPRASGARTRSAARGRRPRGACAAGSPPARAPGRRSRSPAASRFAAAPARSRRGGG